MNQRILSICIDHILHTTARISSPLNVLLMQWPQPLIPNLIPIVLFNPQCSLAKQMACCSPEMPQDHCNCSNILLHVGGTQGSFFPHSCIMAPTFLPALVIPVHDLYPPPGGRLLKSKRVPWTVFHTHPPFNKPVYSNKG